MVVKLPKEESFSEIWILGPEFSATNYPLNILPNEVYKISLGIENHMGGVEYYKIHVKLRNQTDPLPNPEAGLATQLPSLYEYRIFLQDGKNWEAPLTFSFSEALFSENQSYMGSISINNLEFNIDKSASWDAAKKGYYYQLLIELWIYNSNFDSFMFHNRFVGFWLNMTG